MTQSKLDAFDATYGLLFLSGHCDTPGGAEYARVRREWIEAGGPADIDTFIRLRANVGPDGPWLGPPPGLKPGLHHVIGQSNTAPMTADDIAAAVRSTSEDDLPVADLVRALGSALPDVLRVAIRSTVERQVASTSSGRRLVAYDADAVSHLVDNIVGNVAQLVLFWVDE